MTYEEIDALRLKAFKTNSEQDRNAYFEATSKWFQDEVFRRMDRDAELTILRAESERLREAFTNPDHEILAKVCYGVNCYPDELSDMLETYWEALK